MQNVVNYLLNIFLIKLVSMANVLPEKDSESDISTKSFKFNDSYEINSEHVVSEQNKSAHKNTDRITKKFIEDWQINNKVLISEEENLNTLKRNKRGSSLTMNEACESISNQIYNEYFRATADEIMDYCYYGDYDGIIKKFNISNRPELVNIFIFDMNEILKLCKDILYLLLKPNKEITDDVEIKKLVKDKCFYTYKNVSPEKKMRINSKFDNIFKNTVRLNEIYVACENSSIKQVKHQCLVNFLEKFKQITDRIKDKLNSEHLQDILDIYMQINDRFVRNINDQYFAYYDNLPTKFSKRLSIILNDHKKLNTMKTKCSQHANVISAEHVNQFGLKVFPTLCEVCNYEDFDIIKYHKKLNKTILAEKSRLSVKKEDLKNIFFMITEYEKIAMEILNEYVRNMLNSST